MHAQFFFARGRRPQLKTRICIKISIDGDHVEASSDHYFVSLDCGALGAKTRRGILARAVATINEFPAAAQKNDRWPFVCCSVCPKSQKLHRLHGRPKPDRRKWEALVLCGSPGAMAASPYNMRKHVKLKHLLLCSCWCPMPGMPLGTIAVSE